MSESSGLTVITWNVQGSKGLDVGAAAAALAEFSPDVVLVQEVQRRQIRDLARALGKSHHAWRFKHWPVRVPAEGLGVIASRPIVGARVVVLAHLLAFWYWRRRIALTATLEVGGRPVRIVDTHLGAGVPTRERLRQIDRLLAAAPDADLIAGDLNAFAGSPELAAFAATDLVDAERRAHPDRPVPPTNWEPGPRDGAPTQRLDYILVRSQSVVREARVPEDWRRWAQLSDHVPVIARLEL